MKKRIAVSYLGVKDVPKLLLELSKTDADLIHCDVMDGRYVKGKTMSFDDLLEVSKYTKKRLDVHLMVKKPYKYIDDYATLDVETISFHLNTKSDIHKTLHRIGLYGIRKGLVINPDQDISLLEPYLDEIDNIIVMTVVPGLPGQTLIPETVDTLNTLRKIIKDRNLNITLEVDGGINVENVRLVKNADIIVSGSTITKSDDYQKTISLLRK